MDPPSESYRLFPRLLHTDQRFWFYQKRRKQFPKHLNFKFGPNFVFPRDFIDLAFFPHHSTIVSITQANGTVVYLSDEVNRVLGHFSPCVASPVKAKPWLLVESAS